MTLSIMILSIMTITIMIFCIITLGVTTYNVTIMTHTKRHPADVQNNGLSHLPFLSQ